MSVDIFMVDPPWPKKKGGLRKVTPNQTRELDYKTMPIKDIFALLDKDIIPIGSTDHTIFLWCIDEFLHDAELMMKERKYKLHARLIWDKTKGVAPAFSVRYSHEYLLWFYTPKFQKVAKESRGKISTVFREAHRQHSRKPDVAYDMVSMWFPQAVKMDVFSREKREGWLQYGDEIDFFN